MRCPNYSRDNLPEYLQEILDELRSKLTGLSVSDDPREPRERYLLSELIKALISWTQG
jgi:hypothetical protein